MEGQHRARTKATAVSGTKKMEGEKKRTIGRREENK
jgi:hypothetical protein